MKLNLNRLWQPFNVKKLRQVAALQGEALLRAEVLELEGQGERELKASYQTLKASYIQGYSLSGQLKRSCCECIVGLVVTLK